MVIQSFVLDAREITMPLLARQWSRKIADKQAHEMRMDHDIANQISLTYTSSNNIINSYIELFEFRPREDRY